MHDTTKASNDMIRSCFWRAQTCLFLHRILWQDNTPMEINFATGFIRDPSSQFSLVVNQLTLYSLASFSRVFSNNHATTMVLVQLSLSLTFTLQELLQIMVVVIHVESSTRSTHDPLWLLLAEWANWQSSNTILPSDGSSAMKAIQKPGNSPTTSCV